MDNELLSKVIETVVDVNVSQAGSLVGSARKFHLEHGIYVDEKKLQAPVEPVGLGIMPLGTAL